MQQFGLVAEEVEKVNPDLVVRDKEGKPYSVRYEAVNAMLLNEFLKEHRRNEEQEATIARLIATDTRPATSFVVSRARARVAEGWQPHSLGLRGRATYRSTAAYHPRTHPPLPARLRSLGQCTARYFAYSYVTARLS